MKGTQFEKLQGYPSLKSEFARRCVRFNLNHSRVANEIDSLKKKYHIFSFSLSKKRFFPIFSIQSYQFTVKNGIYQLSLQKISRKILSHPDLHRFRFPSFIHNYRTKGKHENSNCNETIDIIELQQDLTT